MNLIPDQLQTAISALDAFLFLQDDEVHDA